MKYITTPIFYVNASPHLGHFYTTVAADVLARFYQAAGEKVKWVTGTDEYGLKVAQAAQKKGIDPQSYVDNVTSSFQEMVNYAGAEPDDFIRTTQPRHYKAVQALWKTLSEKDHIYLSTYEGYYSTRDEAFFDEKDIVTNENGEKKAPTGAPVTWIKEPCYFFRLSAWQEPLLDHYRHHPHAIAPESRYNEVMRFLEGGLKDLAISRSQITWGIPVPGDENHVIYVWMDALTNYLTFLGYPSKSDEEFLPWWNNSLHLIGKDILRFHAVYWPAFLMAAGFPPPQRIFAHGWWTCKGEKMSKSLGNVLDPRTLITTYGLDALRYFVFRHGRFGQDNDFSIDMFVQRCNQELADGIGNLAHRVLSFIHTKLDKCLSHFSFDDLPEENASLILWAQTHLPSFSLCMDQQDLSGYLEIFHQAIQKGNGFMAHLAPWVLLKEAKEGNEEARKEMEKGLFSLVHLLRDLAILISPFTPSLGRNLLEQLGVHGNKLSFLGKPLTSLDFPPPSPLFSRILST